MADDILATALARRQEAADADHRNREEALDDLRFLNGKGHWPEAARIEREANGKPCFVINAMPQYVRQVTGQIRGINPAIKVSPSDGAASVEVAEIYEGLIRQIEADCDAQSVYEGAAESAAQCGIGYFRVRADYEDPMGFDQSILIERIHNPFAVLIDPAARASSRSDMRYCFILDDMPRDAFKETYPDADLVEVSSDSRPMPTSWASRDTITVAEYYWIDRKPAKIALLMDGSVVTNPKSSEAIIKERKTEIPVVKWVKITGKEILEGPVEIPGQFIPVFAVTGEEIHLGEEVYRSGVVRFAKDPQVLYNFARSTQAEITAMQSKSPYIRTITQFDGLEDIWRDANNSSRPYLPYNPDDKAPGRPSREQPPVSSSGIMAEISLAAEDIKRTTGIYDAALGARSNETSGIAINARKMESQNSTSIYADNMVKAITHAGRVIVDMIPRIYDTQRVIRIIGGDDAEKQVVINKIMQSMDGHEVSNDMSAGRYAVRVSVGPSYSTRREEASAGMMEFLRVVPQAGQVTADLVAGAQEWPDSDKFAERLKKVLPPGVVEQDDMPPDQQQAIAAGQQQQQQAAAEQQQIAQTMAQMALRKEAAQAAKAEADADRAKYDAEEARLKLAAVTGQINDAIRGEVARALSGANATMPMA